MNTAPIILPALSIRALLSCRKTQARIPVDPQPPLSPCVGDIEESEDFAGEFFYWLNGGDKSRSFHCPFGKSGDLLWVQEEWQEYDRPSDLGNFAYLASERPHYEAFRDAHAASPMSHLSTRPLPGWHAAGEMPRSASRLTLALTDVAVERLHDITPEGVHAEGLRLFDSGYWWRDEAESHRLGAKNPVEAYRRVWELMHGAGAWAENAWVWLLGFRVLAVNVDSVGARAA